MAKRTTRATKQVKPIVVERGQNGANWWIERQDGDYAAYADTDNYLGSRRSPDEARRLISDYLYPDPR